MYKRIINHQRDRKQRLDRERERERGDMMRSAQVRLITFVIVMMFDLRRWGYIVPVPILRSLCPRLNNKLITRQRIANTIFLSVGRIAD